MQICSGYLPLPNVSFVPRLCENSNNLRCRRFFPHYSSTIELILTCVTHLSSEYSNEQVMKNHIQISKIVFTQPRPIADLHHVLQILDKRILKLPDQNRLHCSEMYNLAVHLLHALQTMKHIRNIAISNNQVRKLC